MNGVFRMSIAIQNPLKKLVKCVVLDLDGTLLNTGQILFSCKPTRKKKKINLQTYVSFTFLGYKVTIFFVLRFVGHDFFVVLFCGYNQLTDGVVNNALKAYLAKYGRQWDGRESKSITGKTPLESAATIIEDYELRCTANELISEFTPMLANQLVHTHSIYLTGFFFFSGITFIYLFITIVTEGGVTSRLSRARIG